MVERTFYAGAIRNEKGRDIVAGFAPAKFLIAAAVLGDGNGIAPFIGSLAGVDPDEPTPPVSPPAATAPVRYLSSYRVRY